MKLEHLIRKKVLILPKDTPAFEAARAMSEKSVGCVVVSDRHGHIVGIVTDRDLACGIIGERLSPDTQIEEVMAPNPQIILQDSPTQEVIDRMAHYGIRRIPVIEESSSGSQHCVGIYTLDDLIASGEVSVEQLRSIVEQQIHTSPRSNLLQERKEAKKEHTLDRFNKMLSSAIGPEYKNSEEISFFLLKCLVRRIPARIAAHFISELPSLLQEEFLDLPAGPDRKISLQWLEKKLLLNFSLNEEDVSKVLWGFWRGLEMAVKGGTVSHVFANLPKDLQQAFQRGRLVA